MDFYCLYSSWSWLAILLPCSRPGIMPLIEANWKPLCPFVRYVSTIRIELFGHTCPLRDVGSALHRQDRAKHLSQLTSDTLRTFTQARKNSGYTEGKHQILSVLVT